MRHYRKLLLLIFFLTSCLRLNAQNTRTFQFTGGPTGGCQYNYFAKNIINDDLYHCRAGVWALLSPGLPFNSLQFNSAGAFAGDSHLTYDASTKILLNGINGASMTGGTTTDRLYVGDNTAIWSQDATIFAYSESVLARNGNITSWVVANPSSGGSSFWSWGSETDSKSGNTKDFAQLGGGYFIISHGGTGTVTEQIGINTGPGSNLSTGVITKSEGLLVSTAGNFGGGSFTTIYGIKNEAQTAGTTNYDYYGGPDIGSFNAQVGADFPGLLGQNFIGAINPAQAYTAFFVNQGSTQSATAIAVAGYTTAATHDAVGIEAYGVGVHTSGTVTNVASVFTSADNEKAGTVTNLIGASISSNLNTGGGTVTTNYGILIGNQTVGTTNWSIFTGTGKSSFGDQVNIRSGTLNIETGGSTTISTGVGSVKMSTANAATNAAWIPIKYNGTTYFVPGWTTNAP